MWCDNYIGIPFKPNGDDRNGLNCWTLLCLVYKEVLNIDLPKYIDIFTDKSLASLLRVARTMKVERLSWALVSNPQPYDLILLRTGEYVWHCGVVIDKKNMLHVMEGINSCVEEYTGLMWKDKVDEFRHYQR